MVTVGQRAMNAFISYACMQEINALVMAIERQELVMRSSVFLNARVLVVNILVEALSPQGQCLLNITHPGQMVNSVSPVSRLVASQSNRRAVRFC